MLDMLSAETSDLARFLVRAECGGLAVILVSSRDLPATRLAVEFAGLRHVIAVSEGDCLDYITELKPDLIVADSAIGFARDSFLSAVEKRKATESLPVLFVASGEQDGITCSHDVESLCFGSLFLMIRATLRRERPNVLTGVRKAGPFALDEDSFRLNSGGRSAVLARTDFCVLGPFFDAPAAVLDRRLLAQLFFGSSWESHDIRSVDAYLARSRRSAKTQLGIDPIRSVRGKGYSLA